MLNKKRTNNARKMKYLALVPMAAGLLLLNNIDAMARVLNEKVAEVIQQPTALATTTVSKMEAANPLPPEKDKIYDTCDIMPEFPGGQNALLQFLAKNIKYPTEAQQQGKQGKVVVTFVIEKDGSISLFEQDTKKACNLQKCCQAIYEDHMPHAPLEKGDVFINYHGLPAEE